MINQFMLFYYKEVRWILPHRLTAFDKVWTMDVKRNKYVLLIIVRFIFIFLETNLQGRKEDCFVIV